MQDILEMQTKIDHMLSSLGRRSMDCAGPVSEQSVEIVEKQLGVIFPKDYREFLRSFGSFGFQDDYIFGIWESSPADDGGGTVLGETLQLRANHNLPPNLVVISGSEYESYICLDCSPSTLSNTMVYFSNETECLYEYAEAKNFIHFLKNYLISISETIESSK